MSAQIASTTGPGTEVKLPVWWEGETNARNATNEEQDLAATLNSLFEHAREAQKPYAAKWRKADNFYRGKQWERQLEKWRAQITVNICFPNIENQLAVMADSSMRAGMSPVEGGDAPTAHALDSLLQINFTNREWGAKFVLGQKMSLKYGGSAFKVGWDPELGMEGDVDLTRISPKCFIPDPMAKDLEGARYIFEAKILTLAEIKRLHPEKGAQVRPDTGIRKLDERGQDITEIKEVSQYNKPTLTPDEESGAQNIQGIRDLLSKALYVECWMKDDSFKTITETEDQKIPYTDSKGEQKFRVKKVQNKRQIPVYPGGRHICFSGGVILLDEPNPFWHREWPYAILPNYPDDENFWGIGELENLFPIQQEVNKRVSQVSDSATAHGNHVWVKDTLSGVKTADLGSKPNLVITTRTGGKVDRIPPTPIPQYIVDGHDRSMRDSEYVSGMHAVLQGLQPGSVRDFSAIRAVQELAERRITMKMGFHQAAIRRIGRLAGALYMQFYDTDRWKRILGKENVNNLIAQRNAQDPSLNIDENNKIVPDELSFQLEEVWEMYDYVPQSEPMTRNTRQMHRDQMKDLVQLLGPSLAPELLKAYNIDNWEEIVQQIEAPAPQIQAQQAPQAAAPPGAAPQQLALPGTAPGPLPPPPGPAGAGPGPQLPPELLQAMTGGGGPPTGAPPPPA